MGTRQKSGEEMALENETPEQFDLRHLLLKKDPQKYVDTMTTHIDKNPQDRRAYFARHQGWNRLGHPEKAIGDLDAAIALGAHPVYHLSRGQILAKLGRHHEALQDYATAEAMTSPSEWVDCWGPLHQACSYAYLGHSQEALAACSRLKEDHWTPGLDGAPGGNKQEVIAEIRQRLASAKKGS